MFSFEAFLSYLVNPYLLGGVGITIGLTIATAAIGLLLALPLALATMSSHAVISAPARFYVWLFRGTPLLVQIVIIYTGLPQLGVRFDVLTSAVIALSLNEAAYLSETIRGGFGAVAKGQVEAAKALSLSRFATLRLVTLPQVIRIIIPPLGNSVNGLLKATSLASVISMQELMHRAQVLMQAKFEVLELYCVAAVYYLLLTSLWGLVQTRLERHYGRGYAPTAKAPAARRWLRARTSSAAA
ncbi:amino acid ABC transporter permease [Verticiella sediminum]|uniref:Glutamate/aspartate import permease protein GltK n=1 Tax=Verticiella sediminum TaxID=1247510 RepID=A0A556A7C9_9BURK|nr:amino acid ABC transporter permease [Verticiella sediminum]TSH88798.1 amino acid ABC transporter permease [Verticiella sediminum]